MRTSFNILVRLLSLPLLPTLQTTSMPFLMPFLRCQHKETPQSRRHVCNLKRLASGISEWPGNRNDSQRHRQLCKTRRPFHTRTGPKEKKFAPPFIPVETILRCTQTASQSVARKDVLPCQSVYDRAYDAMCVSTLS